MSLPWSRRRWILVVLAGLLVATPFAMFRDSREKRCVICGARVQGSRITIWGVPLPETLSDQSDCLYRRHRYSQISGGSEMLLLPFGTHGHNLSILPLSDELVLGSWLEYSSQEPDRQTVISAFERATEAEIERFLGMSAFDDMSGEWRYSPADLIEWAKTK